MSIASQEMTLVIAGRKPERPCRMNCTMPLSGLRKPCSSSPAANPDDQHPHKRAYLSDLEQNVIDRCRHSAWTTRNK